MQVTLDDIQNISKVQRSRTSPSGLKAKCRFWPIGSTRPRKPRNRGNGISCTGYALQENKGNFGSFMIFSASSRAELNWWIFNVDTSHKLISHGEPKLHIQTDASTHGWGGVRGEQRTGGRWNQQEASHHINYLELLAVLLTIKALCGECGNLHIQVQ